MSRILCEVSPWKPISHYRKNLTPVEYKEWSEKKSSFKPQFPTSVHQEMKKNDWRTVSNWWKENNISGYEKCNGEELHNNHLIEGFSTIPKLINHLKKHWGFTPRRGEVKWDKKFPIVTFTWDLNRSDITEEWVQSYSVDYKDIPKESLLLPDDELIDWVKEEYEGEVMSGDIVDSSTHIKGFIEDYWCGDKNWNEEKPERIDSFFMESLI